MIIENQREVSIMYNLQELQNHWWHMQVCLSYKESHTFTYPMVLLAMEKDYVGLCYIFNSLNLPSTVLDILISKNFLYATWCRTNNKIPSQDEMWTSQISFLAKISIIFNQPIENVVQKLNFRIRISFRINWNYIHHTLS